MENLIAQIKNQKVALDQLIAEIEAKSSFEWNDYHFCQIATNRIEENLRRIKHESSDQATRVRLWNKSELSDFLTAN